MAIAKNKKTKKWYSKFRYKDYSGQWVQKKKEGFAKRSEAAEWEQKFLAQHAGTESLTFAEAYERYLADCEKRVKQSTIYAKRIAYKHFEAFYNTPIAEITPLMIRGWQTDCLMKVDPLTKRTQYRKGSMNTFQLHLSTFFSWCVKFCGLPENPVSRAGGVEVKGIPVKEPVVKKIWQVQDFNRFIAGVDRIDYQLAFKLLFWLGLRRGECMALRVKDIDLEEHLVKVRQNMVSGAHGLIIDTPKTPKSVRDVRIPDFLIPDIKAYLKKLYKPKSSDLIFSITAYSISFYFKYIQEQLKIEPEKRLRLHDLRHSHASMLINAGFSPDVVADRLGHANAAMVLKVYGHMYPQRRVEVTNALGKIYLEGKNI